MRRGHFLAVSIGVTAACAGCAVTRPCPTESMGNNPTKVTVRFAVPPARLSPSNTDREAELAVGEAFAEDGCMFASSPVPESGPYHAVLWGNTFNGNNVTYSPAALAPGQYTFGLFDQERDAVYQGWISVNGGGDSIMDVLMDWRDTIHEQEEWLGFENQATGKFRSRDAKDFKQFSKELRKIRRLERRIEKALEDEMVARARLDRNRTEFLRGTEILLVPNALDFFTPSTQPAFSEAELASVATKQPMTKVVLMADYAKAMEKLRRLESLRDDLKHFRAIIGAERNRLERRKRYLTVTDHLYHHGKKFVENETRLREARQLMEQIDQQLDEHRRRSLALAFIAGLSAPDETFDAFDREKSALKRDLTVLQEELHIADLRFEGTNERSRKRIALQRRRQDLLARAEEIESQIDQIGQAVVAFGKLKDTTKVIHRHGTARVLAATLIDKQVPGYIADAIERESLMTVRLQSTDSMFTPPTVDVASTRPGTAVRTVSSR